MAPRPVFRKFFGFHFSVRFPEVFSLPFFHPARWTISNSRFSGLCRRVGGKDFWIPEISLNEQISFHYSRWTVFSTDFPTRNLSFSWLKRIEFNFFDDEVPESWLISVSGRKWVIWQISYFGLQFRKSTPASPPFRRSSRTPRKNMHFRICTNFQFLSSLTKFQFHFIYSLCTGNVQGRQKTTAPPSFSRNNPKELHQPRLFMNHTHARHRKPYRIYRLLIRYAFHIGKNTGMCVSQIGDKAKLSERLLYKRKCKLFLFLLVTWHASRQICWKILSDG